MPASLTDARTGSSAKSNSESQIAINLNRCTNFRYWPLATEIFLARHVGHQGKSGPVVLSVSVSHFDPLLTKRHGSLSVSRRTFNLSLCGPVCANFNSLAKLSL